MEWTKVDADIPTWELDVNADYYVEKWGLGSWAAYHGDVRIGEPGSYGSRDEAQAAAEYEAEHSEPVKWAGRSFGQLAPDEKRRVTREAARKLQDELTAAAPAIAKVMDEAEVRTIPATELGTGCPTCGTDLWGFDNSADEDAGQGRASCDRGHAWIVTAS